MTHMHLKRWLSPSLLSNGLGIQVGTLLFLFVLTLPYWILIGSSGHLQFHPTPFLFSVIAKTFLQASISSLLSLAIGFLMAMSLLWLQARMKRSLYSVLEWSILLPNAAPVLVMLLAFMQLLPWARGWVGIVLVHVLLNGGLCAVVIARLLRDRMGGAMELALVEGATAWQFIRVAVLRGLTGELSQLSLYVFALCFTSFAVPLMLGGATATTVEVLIYQKIRLSADWSEAIALSLVQFLFLLVLSLSVKNAEKLEIRRWCEVSLLARPFAIPLLILPLGILFFGLFQGLVSGLTRFLQTDILLEQIWQLAYGSILVGSGVGVTCLIGILLYVFLDPQGIAKKIFLGIISPSSVLTGFAILIFWRGTGDETFYKLIFGLSLIFFPALLRLGVSGRLDSLRGQIQVSQTLGAGRALIFSKIILPQAWQRICHLAGLASFWAWGEFAFSSVIAEKQVTLALAVQGLMDSYRFDLATVLIFILLSGATLNYLLFWGISHVFGEESARTV